MHAGLLFVFDIILILVVSWFSEKHIVDSSYQTNRSEVKTTSPLTAASGTKSTRYPVSVPVRQNASSSYNYRKGLLVFS